MKLLRTHNAPHMPSDEVSMQMPVFRWGHSLAIRLPMDLVKRLRLKAGDSVEVDVVRAGQTTACSVEGEDVLKRLRMYRGRLPAGFKLDRFELDRQL